MSTFGEMLISRPAGREAYLGGAAYIFNKLQKNSPLELDFLKVKVLAPSWADEFITQLKKNYTTNITYKNCENPSVKASLQTVLEPIDVTQF